MVVAASDRLRLPESLEAQLRDYRRRVWAIKLFEALAAAACGVLVAFLALFVWDRLTGHTANPAGRAVPGGAGGLRTGAAGRPPLGLAAAALGTTGPAAGPPPAGDRRPAAGDHRAGAQRFRAGPVAGVVRGGRAAGGRGRQAPRLPHGRPGPAASAVGRAAGRRAAWSPAGCADLYPAAAGNAWARLLAPWQAIPRYTFAMVEPLPDEWVVPHGEPFTITAQLAADSVSQPAEGTGQLGGQPAVVAAIEDGRYEFSLPPQIAAGWLQLRIGDWQQRVWIEPTLRPELTSLVANVALPAYLQRTAAQRKDVRGGSITLVNGSRARFQATASRRLAKAHVAGRPQPPDGSTVGEPRHAGVGAGPDRVPLGGRVRPGRQVAVHADDQRPRGQSAVAVLRRAAAAEGRAGHRAADVPW